MTDRVVVVVFDWDWNYLGHEFLPLTPDEVNRLPVGKRDSINAEITRRIAPDRIDFHTAMCVVDEDGDLDVERTTRELRDRYSDGDYASRSEIWVDAHGAITASNIIKRRH